MLPRILRRFRSAPVLGVAATFTLGVALNGSVLALLDSVLLRPLPFRDPAQLVAATYEAPRRLAQPDRSVPSPLIAAWQARSRTLMSLAGYSINQTTLLDGRGAQSQVLVAHVTADFFDVLEIPGLVEHLYFPEALQDAGRSVAILGYSYWKSRLGGDESAVGQSLALNGRSYTVVGIAPSSFRFPAFAQPDVMVPLDWRPHDAQVEYLSVIARLRDNVPILTAQSELQDIAASEVNGYPTAMRPLIAAGARPYLEPLQQHIAADLQTLLPITMLASGSVLLLACTNIASMCLAWIATRRDQLRTESMLGASSFRLVLEALRDHVLLSLGGIAAAVLTTWCFLRRSRDVLTFLVPDAADVQLDGRALLATLAVGVLATALSAVLPVVAVVRESRRAGTSPTGAGARGASRLRRAALSAQVALALVLLAACGLLTKTLWQLTGTRLGFEPSHLLTCRVSVVYSGLDAIRKGKLLDDGLSTAQGIPGVEWVGATTALPMARHAAAFAIAVEGEPSPRQDDPVTPVDLASPGYFQAIGARLWQGRPFDSRDTSDAPLVAMVNRAFAAARQGRSLLGVRIGLGGQPTRTIVGILDDVRDASPRSEALPHLYIPFTQAAPQLSWHTAVFAVRTSGRDTGVANILSRRLATTVAPAIVYDLLPMQDRLAAIVRSDRQRAVLFCLLALVAILLALCGVVGVVSYLMAAKTMELGVRAALGASPGALLWCVAGDCFRAVGLGTALGLLGASLVTRLLTRFLFGVGPFDSGVYAASAMVVLAASALMILGVTRPLTRLDPSRILKVT